MTTPWCCYRPKIDRLFWSKTDQDEDVMERISKHLIKQTALSISHQQNSRCLLSFRPAATAYGENQNVYSAELGAGLGATFGFKLTGGLDGKVNLVLVNFLGGAAGDAVTRIATHGVSSTTTSPLSSNVLS